MLSRTTAVEGRRDRIAEERPPARKSHQFRALSRRTGTYHRRQWKLDLCCLGLCPTYLPFALHALTPASP